MTTYSITTVAGKFYVQTHRVGCVDPSVSLNSYANEESAKRRIRNLKAKDAEAVADGELVIVAHGVTINGNGNVSMPIKKAPIDWDGTLTADEKAMIIPPVVVTDEMRKPFDVMATIDPSYADSFERTVPARQRGCYPAISKHSYQR